MKLTIQDGRDSFYTFDSNRILLLTATDEEQIKQVEFSTEEAGGTETWTKDVLEQEDGVKYVQVPNEFLNGDYTRLVCYAVALDSKGEFTRQKEVFRIKYRPQPEDWFLTYSERVTFASIKALTEQYKSNASDSAELASKYAENNEDVAVESGKYSAKHWSIKSNKKYEEIRSYVGSASDPESALGSIESARANAVSDVEKQETDSIEAIGTYTSNTAIPSVSQYVEGTAKPALKTYGEQQVDSYVNGTSKPELDRYVNNEKKNVLDQYTEEKKGELDSYTNTDKKKVLDDYVNNVKKVELNTYTNDKKSELDVYKTTKADELNEHTVSLKGSLDGYTTAKEQEISEFTEQKKSEVQGVYQSDLNELKGDLDYYKNNISSENKISFEFTKTASQRIESDGSIISGTSSYAYVSSLIDIEGYPIIYITARANFGSLIYAFYDKDSNFISGKASSNTEGSTQVNNQKTYIPSNAKYIRLAMTYDMTPTTECYYKEYVINGYEFFQTKLDEHDSKLTEIEGSETYDVIRYPSYTTESGYVDKFGDIGSGNYVHTNKIPVKSGDVIYFVTQSGAIVNNRIVCAYSGDIANPAKGGEYITKYIVPEGIDGVVLSCSSKTGNISYSLVVESTDTTGFVKIVNSRDTLYGKKWVVIGDSFSYGGYSPMNVFDSGRYCGSRKTYPYFIGSRTHINVVDFTLGGRTLAYPSDGSFNNSICCPTASCYYQNIPVDADYITIYLGINDSHHASGSSGTDGENVSGIIPIGTVDDTTVNTFGGAWNVVLSWLMANRPNAHIGIIVSNGVENASYRTLTIEIAKKYGIPYIDLNGDERTPAMIRTVNPNITSSVKDILIQKWAVEPNVNNHPNDDAHEFESFVIENFLRSI